MWCFACLFYCWLTSFLSFILYMMGSPLDRGNGGGQLWSWPLVWWCLSVVFPKTVPKSGLAFTVPACACMAWFPWNNLTHPYSPLYSLNSPPCVRVPPPTVSLKWVTSVDSLTVLWILFSLRGVLRIKGTQIFSLVKILWADKWKRTGARGRLSLVSLWARTHSRFG